MLHDSFETCSLETGQLCLGSGFCQVFVAAAQVDEMRSKILESSRDSWYSCPTCSPWKTCVWWTAANSWDRCASSNGPKSYNTIWVVQSHGPSSATSENTNPTIEDKDCPWLFWIRHVVIAKSTWSRANWMQCSAYKSAPSQRFDLVDFNMIQRTWTDDTRIVRWKGDLSWVAECDL